MLWSSTVTVNTSLFFLTLVLTQYLGVCRTRILDTYIKKYVFLYESFFHLEKEPWNLIITHSLTLQVREREIPHQNGMRCR